MALSLNAIKHHRNALESVFVMNEMRINLNVNAMQQKENFHLSQVFVKC